MNEQIAAWKAQNGGIEPDLIGRHGSQTFKWDTLDNLKAAKVVKHGKEYSLLDSTKIGQKGEGTKMNLTVALSNPNGVAGFGQMPDGGPFMNPANIKKIADWIDDGCPE